MATDGPRARVYVRSLGCPKNQLDTEVMLGRLAVAGFALAERLEDADVAVVNTCSFIEPAREESVDAILELAPLREQGELRALVVTGCLPQRYGSELARELPEVDAFVGTGDFPALPQILDDALAGRRGGIYVEAGRTHLYDEHEPRVLVGPTHSAYLKIAEGCDRICAFCAIPGIRGKFQSRTLDSVLAEARQLAAADVRELNLVAQDSTSWGKDLASAAPPRAQRAEGERSSPASAAPPRAQRAEGERSSPANPARPRLADLVRAIDDVDGLDWIRLLYVYPSAVTDELIDALAGARRVLPYVDVPLQHASDRMLRAMRRGTTRARQERLVARLRDAIPDLTLRTTFIVGFPGETEADFSELLDFVRVSRFDRVGVFRYSDEEGTAAFGLPEKVPAAAAVERHRRLMALQSEILSEKHERLLGSEQTVLVDRAAGGIARARLASQAPEIDGSVLVRGSAKPGEHLQVRITALRGVDLEAVPVESGAPGGRR